MSRLLWAPLAFALISCCLCGQVESWLRVIMHQVPRFERGACPFDVWAGTDVECGFVVVPEDHNDPEGFTIRLATAIVRDRSPGHQSDPVVLLAGGPGGHVVENTLAAAAVYEPLLANRDFVVFDQRGAGLSEPALECPEWEEEALDLLGEPDPNTSLQKEYDAIMSCRDRLVGEGYNLSLYNTTQNAADVEAIRIALGYNEINLYGGSYGSLLAQAVMRDYPERIRSVVMSSVCPLEESFSLSGETTMPDAILRTIDACAANEDCTRAYPDLQDVLFETIDNLNENPVPILVTDPDDGETYDALLTGDTLVHNVSLALYDTDIIPVIPRAIYETYQGDYELMTRLTGDSLWVVGTLSRGMQFSVVCAEDLIGRNPEELLDARLSVPRQLRGQVDPEFSIEYGIFGVCEHWPVEEADPSFKDPLVSDIPTLILEGELDPITPPACGRAVARYLTEVHFHELPGAGHDVLSAEECALGIAGDFLGDPARAPDASCIDDMSGVVFDMPRQLIELVLEPFTDEESGICGLMPEGWIEQYPLDFWRHESALDPTRLVMGATWRPKRELLGALVSWLEIEQSVEAVGTGEMGELSWELYELQVGAYPVDLALSEDEDNSYFTLLFSPKEERDSLYGEVFLPVLEAMAPCE